METNLPKDVQDRLDAYIERVRKIRWFKQKNGWKKTEATKQIKIALRAFGVEAKIEYRKLESSSDWDAARDAAWDAARDAAWDAAWGAAWDAARDAAWGAAWGAAWDAARDAAWGAARDAAWDAARDAARDAAWGAAWDAARGAQEIVASDLDGFTKKYPNGAFLQLISLWEMGLYPIGLIDGKFLVYVPKV